MKIKTLLWITCGLLVVGAIVMMNLAIYYSSEPHNSQMGWAIFCGFNGVLVGLLGVVSGLFAGSSEVAMHQLDRERARGRVPS